MSNESARYCIADLEAEIERLTGKTKKLTADLEDARKRIELDGIKLSSLGEKLQHKTIYCEHLEKLLKCWLADAYEQSAIGDEELVLDTQKVLGLND